MSVEAARLVWAGLAAILVGLSKTAFPGAAIPAVALMAEVFREDAKRSVGALLPILLVGDVMALAYYRRSANWERLIELCPYVLAGMVPGYLVLWRADQATMRVLLGAIVLLLLAVHVYRQRTPGSPRLDRRWLVGVTGLLAGFGTTVGNAAGPVMGIFLVGQRLEKHEFLGTSAWFFLLVNLSKVPFYIVLGMITPATLKLDAVLAPLAILGALAGARLLRWIPQRMFNTLVLLLAGLAALRMIMKA